MKIIQKDDFLYRTHKLLAENRADKRVRREVDLGEIEPEEYESRFITVQAEIMEKLAVDYQNEAMARMPQPTATSVKSEAIIYRVKNGVSKEDVLNAVSKNTGDFSSLLETKGVVYSEKESEMVNGWAGSPIGAIHALAAPTTTTVSEPPALIYTADKISIRMETKNMTKDQLRARTGLHHKTIEKILEKGTNDENEARLVHDALMDEVA